MYNEYAYYSRAMLVYFNRFLFKSISLLPLLHFITLLPFFPLLPSSSFPFPRTFLPSFSSCSFPFLPSFPFYPSFSYPSIPSNLSIVSYLLFSNYSPSFLSILYFLAASFPSNPLYLSYFSINSTVIYNST